MNRTALMVIALVAVIVVSGCTGTPAPVSSPAYTPVTEPSSVSGEVSQIASDIDDSGVDQADESLDGIDFL